MNIEYTILCYSVEVQLNSLSGDGTANYFHR